MLKNNKTKDLQQVKNSKINIKNKKIHLTSYFIIQDPILNI